MADHQLLAQVICFLFSCGVLQVAVAQTVVDPLVAGVKASSPQQCMTVSDDDVDYDSDVQDLFDAVEDAAMDPPSCLDTDVYSSCKEILELCGPKSSGYYWIMSGYGTPVQAYCDMEGTNCGGEGGWMFVYQLNMTNASNECPGRWTEQTNSGKRGCYRSGSGCRSAMFDLNLITFSQVCGQARGYQFGTMEGFQPYRSGTPSADGKYADGLLLTYSNPRKHIWAFVGSFSENRVDSRSCPCSPGSYAWIPAYVGNYYYCESGSPSNTLTNKLYADDELWDGQQCGLEEPCCTNPWMPYFVRTLPEPYSGAIEGQLCTDSGGNNERSNVHYLELWVR